MPTNRTRKVRVKDTRGDYPHFFNLWNPQMQPVTEDVLRYFSHGWQGYGAEWTDLDLFSLTANDDYFLPYWESIKAQFLREWIKEHPCTRPYIWWQLDAPEPLLENETEFEYLQRNELLTGGENGGLQKL